MAKPKIWILVLLLALVSAALAATNEEKCQTKKLIALGKRDLCLQRERAKEALGKTPHMAKCEERFTKHILAAERKVACRWLENGDGTATDLNTGLQWELKTDDGSIHDKDDIYSWSNTLSDPDGGAFVTFLGALNEGSSVDGSTTTGCFAESCDWRLPTIEELSSIVDLAAPGCGGGLPCTTIPGETVSSVSSSSFYWSSTASAVSSGHAWIVFFNDGFLGGQAAKTLGPGDTTFDEHVRAVRGGSYTDTATEPNPATEQLWAELLALDGMHWAYRASNTYTDGDGPASDDDPVLFFEAIGNNIPTVSTLEWKAPYDYSVENVWYADLGSRPVYIDRGGSDEYVRFINGLASNFETEPGQLSPREAMGEDFHFIQCFRTMPGASYEGSVTGGFSWKDRMGNGNQIGLAVAGYVFALGPPGAVTEWGQDNLIEIRLFANGDAEFWLNGERIIEASFPDLVESGLPELTLGTNSHVMSNHFRAAMIKRGSHFTEAELEVIYDTTHVLWPRGQLPGFPYLEGAYPNTATTWNGDTKTWEPPTGTFSGGNGEEGPHQYQWYYWDANDPIFSAAGPLESHLPIPGATQATLTRTDYEPGNAFGHEVIFDDPHDGHVRIMRLITPSDSSGAKGESLTGGWAYDNIP